MAGKLKINLEVHDDWTNITLSGAIVEGAEQSLAPLVQKSGTNVRINMANVRTLNSCGVAEWSEFLRNFVDGRQVTLERCSSEVVDVLNMMGAFAEGTTVESLNMPFQCDSCSHETDVHVKLGKNIDVTKLQKLSVPCPKCQARMEPLVEPEDFLAFWLDAG